MSRLSLRILKQKKTSNSLTKQELRKVKKIQRKKLKQSKKKPSKKANITFNQAQQETQFNKEISFKPPPPTIPEKIDLHKVKNETTGREVSDTKQWNNISSSATIVGNTHHVSYTMPSSKKYADFVGFF